MATFNEIRTTQGIAKVSYPHYGNTKEIEVNFEELKRKEIVRTEGSAYPDLTTQACYAIRGVENYRNSILNTATQLFAIDGVDVICTQLDSIYSYLAMERAAMEDWEKITISDFGNVMDHVYASLEVAKKLLELYLSSERMAERVRDLEYAQAGVLL